MLPDIKHVGEAAKTRFLRRAVAQGFDDAAFTDRYGRIGKGSIWNLTFWTGDAVVWPVAGMLGGVTMRIARTNRNRASRRDAHRYDTRARGRPLTRQPAPAAARSP